MVSSTPIAVNDATADIAMFLMIGALRQAYTPISSLRNGKIMSPGAAGLNADHVIGQWFGKTCLGHDPRGKTLGILGMGGIGRVSSTKEGVTHGCTRR